MNRRSFFRRIAGAALGAVAAHYTPSVLRPVEFMREPDWMPRGSLAGLSKVPAAMQPMQSMVDALRRAVREANFGASLGDLQFVQGEVPHRRCTIRTPLPPGL